MMKRDDSLKKGAVRFRPIEESTLRVLVQVRKAEGSDPVATYSRLMSAAMVAAAIIGVTPRQVGHHSPEMLRLARRAVRERPDIFGALERHDG